MWWGQLFLAGILLLCFLLPVLCSLPNLLLCILLSALPAIVLSPPKSAMCYTQTAHAKCGINATVGHITIITCFFKNKNHQIIFSSFLEQLIHFKVWLKMTCFFLEPKLILSYYLYKYFLENDLKPTLIFAFCSLVFFLNSIFLFCLSFHFVKRGGRRWSIISLSSTCIIAATSGQSPRSDKNWASSMVRGKPSSINPVDLI